MNVFWVLDKAILSERLLRLDETLCFERLLSLLMKFFCFERLLDSWWNNLIWTTFETRWITLLWTSFEFLNEVCYFLEHLLVSRWSKFIWTAFDTRRILCFKCLLRLSTSIFLLCISFRFSVNQFVLNGFWDYRRNTFFARLLSLSMKVFVL